MNEQLPQARPDSLVRRTGVKVIIPGWIIGIIGGACGGFLIAPALLLELWIVLDATTKSLPVGGWYGFFFLVLPVAVVGFAVGGGVMTGFEVLWHKGRF